MPSARRVLAAAPLALLAYGGVALAQGPQQPNGASVFKLAGETKGGFADGTGSAAQLNAPAGLTMDAGGNVVVADQNNHRLRRMTPDGALTTIAGSNEGNGEDADTGAAVTFNQPAGVEADKSGQLVVADSNNNSIRKVDPGTGATVTLAPRRGFSLPKDVAIDKGGGIYVAEADAGWVRKLTGGDKPTVVTKGLSEPWGIDFGPDDSFYVTDYGRQRIRRVYPSGRFYTFAGTGNYGVRDGAPGYGTLGRPAAITVDDEGYAYVADLATHRIRVISPEGYIATIAGGNEGFTDGPARDARFDGPRGIAVGKDGTVYVSDWHNNSIRKIAGVDKKLLTTPPDVGTRRDKALERGIPVSCGANDRGSCRLTVRYAGRVIATRTIRMDYVGRRTAYVKLPADARASVKANPQTRFDVSGIFTGPVGPRRMPPQSVVAR